MATSSYSKRKYNTFSLFVVLLSGMYRSGWTTADAAFSSSKSPAIIPTPPRRILCFGDSLTAGNSPPRYENFPYAPHLEQALQHNDGVNVDNNNGIKSAVVRHRGFPGWTSADLLQNQNASEGLRTTIRAIQQPSLEMVIILVGTNDLAYCTIDDAQKIVDNIIGLHQVCHDEGVPHTLAIGIPPSGYQQISNQAAALARSVNAALAQYCQQQQHTPEISTTYVEFPFGYEPNGVHWAPDGLHFSPTGYQVLGRSLANTVTKILLSCSSTSCPSPPASSSSSE